MSIESITIPVEPEVENLSKIDVDTISKSNSILKSIHGEIMFTSLKQDQNIILDHKLHPVFNGFVSAYKDHRPITISPDIFWLLIIQAFSNHVSTNPEKFRHLFVNFDGKKELLVEREDLNFYTMTSKDWEEFFPDFVNQISNYTGKEIIDTLSPNFTTTTPVTLAVGQLTIMSTMKHYFKFKCRVSGCGFPHITIEGTIEDWMKINHKLNNLSKYDFEWFTLKTIPIIQKIIETKEGHIDTKFWKEMLRIKDSKGDYDPGSVDGWIVSFFPFNKEGNRIYERVKLDEELQPEIQRIPFELEIINVAKINCVFLAGFVGLTQDEKSGSIKPEIGWFIKENDEPEINDSFDKNKELSENDEYENEYDDDDDKNVNDICCLIS